MPGSKKISLLRIGLLMERMVGFNHEVLQGIRDFAGPSRRWACHFADPLPENVSLVAEWGAAGMLAFLLDGEVSESIHRSGIPAVDVANWLPASKVPRVSVDDQAVGSLAAAYLMGLGLSDFAFAGNTDNAYAKSRMVGFLRKLEFEGHRPAVFYGNLARFPKASSSTLGPVDQELSEWLESLPKPVGVFAVNDEMALAVSECCHSVGLDVPDDVAILGVDNDPYLCALGYPPLSSIAIPSRKIGFEAASLLQRMMMGGTARSEPLLIPPITVIARQSTNILAIEDPDLVAAVRFIRERPMASLSVSDVVDHVPISRRTLEKLFMKHLGRSPHEEIQHVKMAEAQRLLAETDLTLEAVAKRTGFSSAPWFVSSFKQQFGITPATYRRQFQR